MENSLQDIIYMIYSAEYNNFKLVVDKATNHSSQKKPSSLMS